MKRQSGVMAIRSLRKWLNLDTDDFTVVTFIHEDDGTKVKRLVTGSWEFCRAEMDRLSFS